VGNGVTEAPHRARPLVREYWPLAAIVLAAVAVSIVVHEVIFPAYSWNRDEPVYLWQVHALRDGNIFTSTGGAPLFFQPWLSGIRDDMFFSQYTLGWPLVLLGSDVVFGTAAAAIVFGTALAVLGTYAVARELTADRSVALVSAAAFTICPGLVIQSGLYLGYLFSLGLGTLFGAALLAGLRTSRSWLLAASGLAVGYLFMTRPFDAFLWALAFFAFALFDHWRDRRTVLRGALWVGLGFLPLLVATLAYNRYVTGSFTEFPITAADPRDTFGFGTRSIGTRWSTTDFTPWVAVKGVGRNGVELPPFLVGSYLGVAVAAVGFWLRRRERSTYALLAIGAAFPIGYLFFWGIALSANFADVSAPLYFIPLLPALCILIAMAVTSLWRRRRGLALFGCVVLVAATVPFMVDRLENNRAISDAQVPWRDAEAEFRGRSLVFVEHSGPYLIHLNPFSSNNADVDGRILYAADRGPENLDLIAARPGRRVYFQRTNLSTEETLNNFDLPLPTITVTEMEVARGRVLSMRVRVTNRGDDPTVVAYARVGDRVDSRTLSTTASRGDVFDVDFRVAPRRAGGDGTLPLGPRLGTVIVGTGSGRDASVALLRQEQQRFAYRIDGDQVELLTPGRMYLARAEARRFKREQVSTLPSLAIDVAPAPTT
jgi:hypothetical protein